MRTTLTIEQDIAAKLRDYMMETGHPLKQSVNDLLRLAIALERKKPQPPFVVTPFKTGPKAGVNFDNVEELLDQMEGPDRKW